MPKPRKTKHKHKTNNNQQQPRVINITESNLANDLIFIGKCMAVGVSIPLSLYALGKVFGLTQNWSNYSQWEQIKAEAIATGVYQLLESAMSWGVKIGAGVGILGVFGSRANALSNHAWENAKDIHNTYKVVRAQRNLAG